MDEHELVVDEDKCGAKQQRLSNDRDHPEWPSFFHAFASRPLVSITLRLLRLLRPLLPKGTSAAVVVVEDRRSD